MKALDTQLTKLKSKIIAKSFDNLQKSYEKLHRDLVEIEVLGEIAKHQERAQIIKTELELFLGDIENGLLEQQELHEVWEEIEREALFIKIKKDLDLLLSEWERFRKPLKTAGADIQNIRKFFGNVPVEEKMKGLLQQKDVILESQHLIIGVKSLTSKVYQNFVDVAAKNAQEIHRKFGKDLEAAIGNQPTIMIVPHLFGFLNTVEDPRPLTKMEIGEQVQKIRIYNKKTMKIDENNLAFDYSYVESVRKKLDVDFELGIVGFTNLGNVVELDDFKLVHKTPTITNEQAFSGFVQEEYEVTWEERIERIEEKKFTRDGKERKFISKKIENIEKKSKIKNELEIWNLVSIRGELSKRMENGQPKHSGKQQKNQEIRA